MIQLATAPARLFVHCRSLVVRPAGANRLLFIAQRRAASPSAVIPRSRPRYLATMSKVEVEVLADRLKKPELEKPELDDRSYRVIRLPNQLEALLAHDPDTDKASASVNVKVGSFSDADNMPGMAHAVEHLLFMGTEKYPVENAYSQYLSSHAGYSNAYTAPTETNYFFEVAAKAEDASKASGGAASESPLRGALDRFAQFFIAPLFLAETLNRELHAVDSENKKNLQSDTWRLSQLDKSLSNPKHPYHHFSTGNLSSLRDEPLKRGVDLRKAFIDFHTHHYSANRMKLVVVGRESLDELQSWVVELFSDVKNKALAPNLWPGVQPYTKETLLKQIFVKPVMDTRILDISFSYRNEEELYETQPSHYCSHLIGHEGPGSILAYIKAKGWANDLSAGGNNVCPDSGTFTVSVRLTEEGLVRWREVTKVIFQYISMIKEVGPQEWVVDELKMMSEVDFRFRQKAPASSFSSRLSSTMQKPIPRHLLLSGTSVIRHFDPKVLRGALDLFTADNFRVTLVSQHYGGDWDQKEKWYGTPYKIEDIPADFLADIRKAISSTSAERPSDLHMPHKNDFIPSRLTVEKKENVEPSTAPKLIRKETSLRVWWKKDDQYWVPKAEFIVAIRNPIVMITPANYVKAKLFCQLVQDDLAEYAYDGEISGIAYSLGTGDKGLALEVIGYNEKMPLLLERVLQSMRDLVVKRERFEIMKEKLIRAYRNWDFSLPYHQVGEFTRHLTGSTGWLNEDFLTELKDVTADDITAFIPQLLGQVHLDIFAHGNLYKEDALRMTKLVESIIKPRALPPTQWTSTRSLLLPPGSDFTFSRALGDPANVNNCIEYYLFVSSTTDAKLRAKTLLLGQMGDERAFDSLRSKQQLGYIVFTGMRAVVSTFGYRAIIQSDRSTEHLESRINAFLVGLGKSIHEMSDSEFEGHKRSIVNRRTEKLKNLEQEFNRFWKYISSNYLDFSRHEIDAANLRAITREEMVEFFNHYIDPTSPHRAKLSVHLWAQAKPPPPPELTEEERRGRLTEVLGKAIANQSVEFDGDALAARVKKLELHPLSETGLNKMLSGFLSEGGHATTEQTSAIQDEVHKDLRTTLLSFGVELLTAEEEEYPAPPVKATTFIKDISKFKAGFELSTAPMPVVDISTFEELDPKL